MSYVEKSKAADSSNRNDNDNQIEIDPKECETIDAVGDSDSAVAHQHDLSSLGLLPLKPEPSPRNDLSFLGLTRSAGRDTPKWYSDRLYL